MVIIKICIDTVIVNVIIIIIIIIINDRFVGLVVTMTDYWSWGHGFDTRHFHKF